MTSKKALTSKNSINIIQRFIILYDDNINYLSFFLLK